MIVFETKRLIIITPPHTASGMLHRVSHAMGALCVVGPTPDGYGFDQHFCGRCVCWEDFRRVVVWRNPCHRLTGLYFHHQWWAANQGWDPISLEQFVRHVVTDDSEALSWFYRYNQSRWLGAGTVDDVIRYENLQNDFGRVIEASVRLPARPIEHPPHEHVWNDRLQDLAINWISEDERFAFC